MAKIQKKKVYLCPVEATIGVIGGKWKSLILYHLIERGILRFNEFSKLLPPVTAQMLTAQLRELESDGLIHRKVYAQVPPKVEYSLTPFGKTIIPLIVAMTEWGNSYIDVAGGKVSLSKATNNKKLPD